MSERTCPDCGNWVTPVTRSGHSEKCHIHELARWAEKARTATVRRDELIRQMRSGGSSLRVLGEAAGLSHMAVSKIADRGE